MIAFDVALTDIEKESPLISPNKIAAVYESVLALRKHLGF